MLFNTLLKITPKSLTFHTLTYILRKMTLRGKKALIRSLKLPLDMAGLKNLHNFKAPVVLKEKLSVVLATSRKFCISEQRLGKI